MLEGDIALVTGASRGIGQAIALALGRAGAVVAGTATTEAGADRISETLTAHGCQGAGLVLDVANPASVDSLMERLRSDLGEPSILPPSPYPQKARQAVWCGILIQPVS